MKQIKNKNVILAALAVMIVFCLGVFQSCSNEDIPLASQQEYLDLDVANLQNPSEEQKIILKKAKDRIDPYVVLNNKEYSVTVTSGTEIQMSERLFDLMTSNIKNINLFVKNLNVIADNKDSRLLLGLRQSNLNTNKRFKILGYESVPKPGENSWNADWEGVHISLNNVATNELATLAHGGAIGLAAATAWATKYSIPDSYATVLAGLSAVGLWEIEEGLKENTGNGVTITTLSYWPHFDPR